MSLSPESLAWLARQPFFSGVGPKEISERKYEIIRAARQKARGYRPRFALEKDKAKAERTENEPIHASDITHSSGWSNMQQPGQRRKTGHGHKATE